MRLRLHPDDVGKKLRSALLDRTAEVMSVNDVHVTLEFDRGGSWIGPKALCEQLFEKNGWKWVTESVALVHQGQAR